MLEIQDQLHTVNTIQNQFKENAGDQTSTHFYINTQNWVMLYYTAHKGFLVSNDNTGNSSVFSCFCGRGQSRLFVQ